MKVAVVGGQAMGNFPYRTGYLLNNAGTLPAYPVRVACQHLAEPHLEAPQLLSKFADAAGVFFNHSGHLTCYDYRCSSPERAPEEVGRRGGGTSRGRWEG
jgi:hypothetical protein